MKQIAVSITLLILLAGCGNATLNKRSYTSDPSSFLRYAAANKDVKTIVVGNPTSQSNAVLARRVTANLNASYAYLKANFSTQDTANMQRPYKVVFAFNPPFQTSVDEICAAPEKVTILRPKEKVLVMAAFCEDKALTEVWSHVEYSGKNRDQNLNDAIKQIAENLVRQDTLQRYSSNE